MITGFLVALLFVGSNALKCGSSVTNNDYFVASLAWVGSAGNNREQFSLTLINSIPNTPAGTNVQQQLAYDIHAFALVDPGTSPVSPSHLDFFNLNGGASQSLVFSVPSSMTGRKECLEMGFVYRKMNGVEESFYGTLSLALVNQTVAVQSRSEDSVELSSDVAARAGCETDGAIAQNPDGFGAVYDATPTVNSWRFNIGSSLIRNVKYNIVSPGGVTINFGSSVTSWTSINANSYKTGSVMINCISPQSYITPLSVNLQWSCGTNTAVYYSNVTRDCYCN